MYGYGRGGRGGDSRDDIARRYQHQEGEIRRQFDDAKRVLDQKHYEETKRLEDERDRKLSRLEYDRRQAAQQAPGQSSGGGYSSGYGDSYNGAYHDPLRTPQWDEGEPPAGSGQW